jgi:hypothetical protein
MEKDIGFGTMLKERQSQHFVIKIPSPALRPLFTVPQNCLQKSGSLYTERR